MGQSGAVIHNFEQSLKRSHAADELAMWETVYRRAFPDMVEMINHRMDGDHQRLGVDRSIIMSNSKQILIDEKVRWKAYEDIALEFISDSTRQTPGWVRKSLLCDYIAYAIAPIGRCYLLPVLQLQRAWKAYGNDWIEKYGTISAKNHSNGRSWNTISCCVPVHALMKAIDMGLRAVFPVSQEKGKS